jgi:hypothetical protein
MEERESERQTAVVVVAWLCLFSIKIRVRESGTNKTNKKNRREKGEQQRGPESIN